MDNFYTLLGCKEDASFEEIKKCYQDLIRKTHPDKSSQCDDTGAFFIQITEAWHTLRDPVKRKAYDAQLLAEQCDSERVLYATLQWSDMNLEGDLYSYPCRCGSFYSISIDDQLNVIGDVYCQCPECSLGILIKSS